MSHCCNLFRSTVNSDIKIPEGIKKWNTEKSYEEYDKNTKLYSCWFYPLHHTYCYIYTLLLQPLLNNIKIPNSNNRFYKTLVQMQKLS
jgi:hypothetical protein